MKLSCKDISSDSVRDIDDMGKKNPIYSGSPNTPLGRILGQMYAQVCVQDTAAQMIGNTNADSCRAVSRGGFYCYI